MFSPGGKPRLARRGVGVKGAVCAGRDGLNRLPAGSMFDPGGEPASGPAWSEVKGAVCAGRDGLNRLPNKEIGILIFRLLRKCKY